MIALKLKATYLILFLVTAPIVVSSCGGGGGGGVPGSASQPAPPPPLPPPPPPPPPTSTVWQQGVYPAASSLENQCEIVRTGLDSEGVRFPDILGSLLIEKFWLRSWTNETYLWNTEVVDRDPAATPAKLAFFDLLKTTGLTDTGRPKDNFHFTQPTAEYLNQKNSAAVASYGASFVTISSTRPRDIRVRYTEPNSPASEIIGGQANFVRGSKIVAVNGIDVINGATTSAEVAALNAGLSPASPGITNTFVVRDPGATADRTFTITSASISPKPVNRTSIIATPTGNVGYILFNTFSPFSSEREIRDAIEILRPQAPTDLVLDLRYNGGGLLAVSSQLSYMIAGPVPTNGKVFERLRFNNGTSGRNPVTGSTNSPTPFYTTGLGFSVPNGMALPSLNLRRVYVLSTARTCSASESVINGLRGAGIEVVLIGGTTCGKPYGFYAASNCGETYFSIQFQGENHLGFGAYSDGFAPNNSTSNIAFKIPGCSVADDFNNELGNSREALLAAALSYRATGTCAPPSSSGETPAQGAPFNPNKPSGSDDILTDPLAVRLPAPGIFETNRDMRMPR
jgi:carboxyl-terminal processing protease